MSIKRFLLNVLLNIVEFLLLINVQSLSKFEACIVIVNWLASRWICTTLPVQLFQILFELFRWSRNPTIISQPPVLDLLHMNLIFGFRIFIDKVGINLILSLKISSQTQGLLIVFAKLKWSLKVKFILSFIIVWIDI